MKKILLVAIGINALLLSYNVALGLWSWAIFNLLVGSTCGFSYLQSED
jgi:hypothetical protein